MRTFGEQDPTQTYFVRRGGYAVILDEAHRVALVRMPNGFWLPGGGVEGDESVEDAAHREVLEECGRRVSLVRSLGVATEYLTVRGSFYVAKVGTFFLARFASEVVSPPEPDHETVWVSVTEAGQVLRHGSQRWAVQEALAAEP